MGLLVVMALVVAACGGDGESSGTTAGDGGGEGGTAGGDGELAGTTVEVFIAFTGDDQEVFEANLAPFEEETGIDVVVEASQDFEAQMPIRIEGGNPPDVAFYPQPGAASGVADELVDLAAAGLDRADAVTAYGEYFAGLGTVAEDGSWPSDEGKWYGIPNSVNVKSLIWYPVPEFAEAGYEVPETWEDLLALSEQIVADGNTPWCIGMEDGPATGWIATDWMEDIMLRTAGVDGYDAWVAHDIPFDAPEVKAAAERFGEIAFTEGFVLGGPEAIVSVSWQQAQNPMFNDQPGCFLHRQASFITSQWPDGVTPGPDGDANFFPFPTIEPDVPQATLGGGDMVVAFADRPEVIEFFRYLMRDDYWTVAAQDERNATIAANANFDTSLYVDPIIQGQAEIAAEGISADTFRFDGSDNMPQAVGSDSFWSGMVEYVRNGPESVDEVLSGIEASWPSS